MRTLMVNRHCAWGLICLLALLLPLFPDAASAQDPLPGVRHRIYESPHYHYTFVWDDTIWTPVAAMSQNGVDRLDLESATTRFTVQGAPRTVTAQQCAAAEVNAVQGLAGTHTVEIAPQTWGEARVRTIGTDAQGAQYDVTRDIDCVVDDELPYQLTYVHLTWTHERRAVATLPQDIMTSMLPPDTGAGDVGQRPPHEIQGIVQVTEGPIETRGGGQQTGNVLITFELFFENLDIYDAQLDVTRIVLRPRLTPKQTRPPDTFTWLLNTNAQNAPLLTLPAGSSVTGRFSYFAPDVEATYDVCYRSASGTECPRLASVVVYGAIGGGSGYRPRIDPGR